jgi:hypothetical protein
LRALSETNFEVKLESALSHIAILVPSVRKATDHLLKYGFEFGDKDVFDETNEIYVQGDAHNPLLLIEAKETGSYRKALEKRGPGIHHIALDVTDLNLYLKSLEGSGWLLHLTSVRSIKDLKTAYLARPGFPCLIEVQEKKKLMNGPLFVEKVHMKFDSGLEKLVKAIGQSDFLKRSEEPTSLQIRGQTIALQDLC